MALPSSSHTASKYLAFTYRDGQPPSIFRNRSRQTMISSPISTSFRQALFAMDPCKHDDLTVNDDDLRSEERKNWVKIILQMRKRRENKTPQETEEEADVADCMVAGDSEAEAGGCEILYSRETFSRFLSPVPRHSIKLYSKLAFLSSAAYMVSKLKTINLKSRFRVRFVTSSMEKKAEANTHREALRQDAICESPDSDRKALVRISLPYDVAVSAATYFRSRLLSRESKAGEKETEMAVDVAATAITALVAAEENEKEKAAKGLRSEEVSTCEWFVCDDMKTKTRYFVIQGSETKASWQANLLFEPANFEGTEGIVHRGVYEAAKGIYNQLLPEIRDFLDKNGEEGKLQFTGHSLGGSLAILVHLMLIRREIVKPLNVHPVVSFGAPFVFCKGSKMLEELGIGDSTIHCIVMHRDIVPRAFSCSYPNQISTLLKRVNCSFRTHPCLLNKKMLYSPLGKVMIVQPDERVSPHHPLLPEGAAIYELEEERAVREFLNCPHPVEVLSNPGAYGSKGTILRDHDSTNYLKAINTALRNSRLRKKMTI